MAGVRSAAWGFMLTPTQGVLPQAMLPHSFTLLVEGEAYILASFFGLLVPIFLFRASEGPTVVLRYGRSVLLNLKGSLWVLIVVAIAALYEASDVVIAFM